MIDIFVSDLFGYNINNDTPFVIINSQETYKLLKKIAKSNNTSIWEYNKLQIDEILKLRNVNPSNFVTLGHVLYKENKMPTMLILANISIAKQPTNFIQVGSYGNGKIYKPVYDDNNTYCELGLVYSENTPVNLQIFTIPASMTIKVKTGNKIDTNEFFLLSDGTMGVKTIKRNALMTDDFVDMKLTHTSNKFLTMIDGEQTNKAVIKSKRSGSHQALSYNTQGELITDSKCMTYSDETNPVFFDDCTNNKKQKWHIFDNKVSPQHNSEKCLTVENDSVYIKQCTENNDNQSWTTGATDDSDATYAWNKYRGKSVVLVESNNPWYVNSDQTVQLEIIDSDTDFHNDVKYRSNADFKSEFIMDPNGHHLGFGSSYADRLGDPCDKIEQFNENANNEDNQLIFIMLCILFMIIIYKVWNK